MEEVIRDSNVIPIWSKLKSKNRFWMELKTLNVQKILLHLFGAGLGILYFVHVSRLFENVTRFSHLSHNERELSLPMNVAFRYGFYKRIAESNSFLDGLRRIVRDRDANFQESVKRFQQYSLTPEVVQAAGFHLFRRFTKWTRLDSLFNNKCSGGHGSIFLSEVKIVDDISCSSGPGNLLYFYLNFIWVIESFTFALLFHFGFILSESIGVGLTAGLLFVISHPQRTTADWLFPSQVKLEWAVFLTQTYIISNVALRRTHPSWTSNSRFPITHCKRISQKLKVRESPFIICTTDEVRSGVNDERQTVKIGVSTGILILVSQTEAQWLLISQLVTITIMQILDLVNPYVASLIIFGQITGWQYASLVSLDTSFPHWSIYFYVFISSIVTVYALKPFIDWISGPRLLPKWSFLQKTSLVIAFQVIIAMVWKESRRVFGLAEDPRLSLAFQPGAFHFYKDSVLGDSSLDPVSRNYDESGGKLAEALSNPNKGSAVHTVNVSSILQFCFSDKPGLSLFSFLTKYGFQILVIFYVFSTCVLLPVVKLRARRTTVAQIRDKRRRASYLQPPFYLSARLNHLYAFILTQNTVIIFNLLQTIAFGFFTVCLEGRWELLFTSHLCLMLSLLCDQKRISLAYRKMFSNRPGNGVNYIFVHWPAVMLIFCIIFTLGKLRSDQMYQNSRGRFEIENQRRKHFSESLTWIKENTEKTSTLAGIDILMVYAHLSTGRSCNTLRQRYDIHFMVEQDETKQVETKTKFELTRSEILARIYSMYSRGKSISEYYRDIAPFNITHLFLSRDACSASPEQPISKSIIEPGIKPAVSTFYDFLWKWGESSSQQSEVGYSSEFHRSCDITRLWNPIASAQISQTENNQQHTVETGAPSSRTVKGSRNKKETEGSVSEQKNEPEPEPDTICVRLLNDRNVKPLTRVFENSDYTILALTRKQPLNRSKNTNQIRTTARG